MLALALGVLGLGRGASAQSAAELAHDPAMSLTFRSVYHGYQVRLFDPSASTLAESSLFRDLNPLYLTLDLGAWNLGPGSAFDTVVSMRYTTDFGTGFHRDTPADAGVPATDGRSQASVLSLYVDWRDVIDRRLDVRLGRQLQLDDLDWYALDGLKGSFHLARTASASVDLEVYVGAPVRLGALLSSTPTVLDGTEISDGPGLAFGGAVMGRFFGDLSVSAAYRQELVFRREDLVIFRPISAGQQSDLDPTRAASAGKYALEEQLVGASVGYTVRPLALDLFGSAVWNLVFGGADRFRFGVGVNPDPSLHLQAEVIRMWPRFAADSIFNIFNVFPYTRGRFEASYQILPALTANVGYFAMLVHGGRTTSGTGPEFTGSEIAHGPSVGVVYRRGGWTVGADAEASTNFEGRYAFGGNYRRAELYGDGSFLDGRLGGVVRVGLTTVQNDWFEKVDTGQVAKGETSYTVLVGGRARVADPATVRLDVIKNFGAVLEGSYRMLAVLELRY